MLLYGYPAMGSSGYRTTNFNEVYRSTDNGRNGKDVWKSGFLLQANWLKPYGKKDEYVLGTSSGPAYLFPV